MVERIEIRNTECSQRPCPHVLDVLVDGDSIYLEIKCRKCMQRISLKEVLRQVREGMEKMAGGGPSLSRKTELRSYRALESLRGGDAAP